MNTKAVSIISITRDKNNQQKISVASEKRVSQWEELMRKFSESNKEECKCRGLLARHRRLLGIDIDHFGYQCSRMFSPLISSCQLPATCSKLKSIPLDIPRVQRSLKVFPSGSQYEGTWDVLGMSGYGVYIFPNGVEYEGGFEDGMFHGIGEMRYPNGTILRGEWDKGVMVDRTLIFDDGLEYSEYDWKYCKMPDRRFAIEYANGLKPAGQSYLTAQQPTRDIPAGYYDTGDGFFDPKTKVVYKADDLTAILRSPSIREQKWIMENCRKNPATSTGPRPDLYEVWSKPETDPELPPSPAVASRAACSTHGSQSVYEQDFELEIKFRNLEEDTTGSSSASD